MKRSIQSVSAARGELLSLRRVATGLRACLDLVAVDRADEVCPRREMPVDGADTNPSAGSNVTHRHVDPGGDKGRAGRGEQGLLVAPGVGSFPRDGRG